MDSPGDRWLDRIAGTPPSKRLRFRKPHLLSGFQNEVCNFQVVFDTFEVEHSKGHDTPASERDGVAFARSAWGPA